MKYAIFTLFGSLFLLLAGPAAAVTIYECVDDEGNITYQDRCPPGTTPAGEKKMRTGTGGGASTQPATGGEQPDVDITLYTAPDCDACLILKGIMDEYQAPYSEQNINSSDEVKRELQEKLGGASTLTIPTIIIGEQAITGYKKTELIAALEQAGFSKPAAEEPAAEEEEQDLAETAFVEEEETTAPQAEGTLEVIEDEQGRQSLRPVE